MQLWVVQGNNLFGLQDPPADVANRNHSQAEHHSATEPTTAPAEREKTHLPRMMCHIASLTHNTSSKEFPKQKGRRGQAKNLKPIGQKPMRRALGKTSTRAYSAPCRTPHKVSITAKLNIFGHVVYEEGREGFREMPWRRVPPNQIGRRQREILPLVKERCLLEKSWRKATDEEKEGLRELWNQVRAR